MVSKSQFFAGIRLLLRGALLIACNSLAKADELPIQSKSTEVVSNGILETTIRLTTVVQLVSCLEGYKILGCFEANSNVYQIKLAGNEVKSIREWLEQMRKSTGLSYQFRNGRVFIFDPRLRVATADSCPLNCVIEDVDFSNVTPAVAIGTIINKHKLGIAVPLMSKTASSRLISVKLRRGSVRDAIQAIADAAGGLSWQACSCDFGTDPGQSKEIVIFSLFM